MQKNSKKIVILGTGGTIAGHAADAKDVLGYTAGQVSVADLLARLPTANTPKTPTKAASEATISGASVQASAEAPPQFVSEQVAQIDSKDLDFPLWQQLASRVEHHLAQSEVQGVVITHGTDTLEETAYFLHRVLAAACAHKPVVLTCAMRPASAAQADGPQNLSDALLLAQSPGARGVLVVCAGDVHSALQVQKVHCSRLNAFDSGDASPLARIENATLTLRANWPTTPEKLANTALAAIEDIAIGASWPRVEVLMNHAGASGQMVDALWAANAGLPAPQRVRGIVVAGTGNGSLHYALEAALLRAQAAGLRVLRATRCAYGQVQAKPGDALPDSKGLSPVKARVELMLQLIGAGPAALATPMQQKPAR